MLRKLFLYFLSFFLSACATLSVNRQQFFQDTMGITESEFSNFYINSPEKIKEFLEIQILDNKPIYFLKNKKTGKQYQAGYFQEFSIAQLRNAMTNIPTTGNGTFNVIEARNPQNAEYRKYVDIGALQADPVNNDAVFQVASNFSALEPVSMNDYPEDGITKYIYDYTQGPFAAISAAPGLIYRMYYLFYDNDTNPAAWRQTTAHQINLLDNTTIPVTNGYIVFDKNYLARPLDKKMYEQIKVGFHRDIQVTYGFLNNLDKHTKVTNPDQIIHQVFTAAVDFGNTNYQWISHNRAQEIGQLILDAAYEGTIRSAIVYSKKKLFLTLIGGGVFNNKFDAIGKAIGKNIDVIKDYGLEVTLIIYDSSSAKLTDQMPALSNHLHTLVEKTNGKYTVHGS